MTRSLRVGLLLLTLQLGLGLVTQPHGTTATAQAPAPPRLGLDAGQVLDDAGEIRFTDADAERMRQAGARWVRINFRLGPFQDWGETATLGVTAVSRYETIVATARRHDLEVLGLLSNEARHGYVADWSAGSAETAGGTGENPYLRGFVDDGALPLIRHFAGQVDQWEVWNEPNAAATWLYPSNFAWLLAKIYAGAREAGVGVRLISGGLSSVQAAGDVLTTASVGADYLRATYAQGLSRAGWETVRARYGSYPLDAVGQHIYVDGYRPTSRTTIATALQLVRDAVLAGEGSNTAKPTVITEVGWASGNVGERAQADNLQLAFGAFAATPFVEAASWFLLRDNPDERLSFGLLRADGTEKPTWQGYRIIAFPETPPLPPVGLGVTGLPDGPRLAWQPNAAPDLAGYVVYRRNETDGTTTRITDAPLTGTTFSDPTAPSDVPLAYTVTALDSWGHESAPSPAAGGMRIQAPTLEPFARTWARTDQLVAETQVQRTWMWGQPLAPGVMTERYDDAPGGYRQVQYYEKSRMELASENRAADDPWAVTNGLLVVELLTGRLQVGDNAFVRRAPSDSSVAGDPGSGPSYAVMGPLRSTPALPEGAPVVARLAADGQVTSDPTLAARGVTAARRVPETGHTVASPFWAFMTSSGPIVEQGAPATGPLFANPFYATGYPVTEAYWTTVAVGGVVQDVLVQCFERRCLTYTPGNPAGWEVEAGNVGLHYYVWRYGGM